MFDWIHLGLLLLQGAVTELFVSMTSALALALERVLAIPNMSLEYPFRKISNISSPFLGMVVLLSGACLLILGP